VFTDNTGKDVLIMNYDATAFDIQTILKPMDDSQMKGNWGDHLVRVSCIVKNKSPKGEAKFTFNLPKS
jgi:hypothetical protein